MTLTRILKSATRGAFNEWELTRDDYDDARTWEKKFHEIAMEA